MKIDEEKNKVCQIRCLPAFYSGNAEVPPESLFRKLRLFTRRKFQAPQVRKLKNNLGGFGEWFLKIVGKNKRRSSLERDNAISRFKPGDIVRVRSEEEIKSTLNVFGQLQGCMFMPEMLPFCDTKQKVLKPLERFVDERDYKVKICKGLVLLENLNCEGTSDYGRCDRSCYYFWREEWLEKQNNRF